MSDPTKTLEGGTTSDADIPQDHVLGQPQEREAEQEEEPDGQQASRFDPQPVPDPHDEPFAPMTRLHPLLVGDPRLREGSLWSRQ
jgi:hypothetical protein